MTASENRGCPLWVDLGRRRRAVIGHFRPFDADLEIRDNHSDAPVPHLAARL